MGSATVASQVRPLVIWSDLKAGGGRGDIRGRGARLSSRLSGAGILKAETADRRRALLRYELRNGIQKPEARSQHKKGRSRFPSGFCFCFCSLSHFRPRPAALSHRRSRLISDGALVTDSLRYLDRAGFLFRT